MKVISHINGSECMLNKNGYVMIYVLGVIALLMLLAATLTNVTMYRTRRTNKEVAIIQESSKARAQIEAAANEIALYFENLNNLPDDEKQYLYEMIENLENIYFSDIQNTYDVEIIPNNDIIINNDNDIKYSYEYNIVYKGKYVSAQKKMFLSMMPSFLFFALGSNTDLNINGGAYIDGDMYVNRNLYISDNINYIVDDVLYPDTPSSLSTVSAKSRLYYGTSNHLVKTCQEDCFINDNNIFTKTNFSDSDIAIAFASEPPKVLNYPNRFLNVNFDDSFLYYIEKDIIRDYPTNYQNLSIENIDEILYQLYNDGLIEDYNGNSGTKSVIINESYLMEEDIVFNKNHWIIVNGDLEIRNYDNHKMLNVDANILVNGDITITGNVLLNSTIYALGEGTVHNANINIYADTDDELVLLTKGRIKFSKINEFVNIFNGIETDQFGNITIQPSIRGFFYTDSFVEIYTVNSYLTIKGGVFSNDLENQNVGENGDLMYITDTDSIGLLINSFQGEVYDNDDSSPFEFIPYDDFSKARFVISHSESVITSQPKGLPVSKLFNYLFEDTTIKRL